jgi:hypothetical protein
LIFEVEFVFFSVFQLGLAKMKKSPEMVWPEMVTHGWVLSFPVGHVSPVVSTLPEQVGGLVICLGLFGVFEFIWSK